MTSAMILAAGLGTRMGSLTQSCPKPLLCVAGKPLFEHILRGLQAYGAHPIVSNTHYMASMIHEWAHENYPGVVHFSYEDVLLETGGGILKALPLLGKDPFFAINGDTFCQDSTTTLSACLEALEKSWDNARMDVLLVLVPTAGERGDFVPETPGALTPIVRWTQQAQTSYSFTGIQMMSPEAFIRPPPTPAFSNNVIWDQALEKGRLFGLIWPMPWFHVGTFHMFQSMNQILFD